MARARRLRLTYVQEIESEMKAGGLDISWWILVQKEWKLVSDICQEIMESHRLHRFGIATVELQLQSARLPPKESIDILRDEDNIEVDIKMMPSSRSEKKSKIHKKPSTALLEITNHSKKPKAHKKPSTALLEVANDSPKEKKSKMHAKPSTPNDKPRKKHKTSSKETNAKAPQPIAPPVQNDIMEKQSLPEPKELDTATPSSEMVSKRKRPRRRTRKKPDMPTTQPQPVYLPKAKSFVVPTQRGHVRFDHDAESTELTTSSVSASEATTSLPRETMGHYGPQDTTSRTDENMGHYGPIHQEDEYEMEYAEMEEPRAKGWNIPRGGFEWKRPYSVIASIHMKETTDKPKWSADTYPIITDTSTLQVGDCIGYTTLSLCEMTWQPISSPLHVVQLIEKQSAKNWIVQVYESSEATESFPWKLSETRMDLDVDDVQVLYALNK